MKVTALAVSVWHADDYLNDRNTNPMCVDKYVFKNEEEAKAFALNLDHDSDIYNDGTIYEAELDTQEVLELTYFDSEDEFWEGIHGNLHEDEVADMVIDEDDCGVPCDCANYDFDKTLEGAILVIWSWQTHVGYARKCEGLRYGYSDDTEELLTKQDRTFVSQMDVVMTADEVAASSNLESDLTDRLLGHRDTWKWTNPNHVEFLIGQITED